MAKTLSNGAITVTLPDGIRWIEQHKPQGAVTAVVTDISGVSNDAIVFQQLVATGHKITLELGALANGNGINGVLNYTQKNQIFNMYNNLDSLTLVFNSSTFSCKFAEPPEFISILEYNDETKDYFTGTIPLVTV
jgi:hypothetical protein